MIAVPHRSALTGRSNDSIALVEQAERGQPLQTTWIVAVDARSTQEPQEPDEEPGLIPGGEGLQGRFLAGRAARPLRSGEQFPVAGEAGEVAPQPCPVVAERTVSGSNLSLWTLDSWRLPLVP